VHVGVTNGLSGRITHVHADVEATHYGIVLHHLGPKHPQKLVDCTPLGLEQVEEGRCVAFRNDQRKSRSRKSAQGDKWSFCLTAGTLCPANQERR
jgi:hypothetical protein